MWSGAKKAGRQTRSLPRSDARTAILDAARKLIARKGLSGLSLSAVAEEAGFVAATVYGHFRSKDELALALAAEDPDGARVLIADPRPDEPEVVESQGTPDCKTEAETSEAEAPLADAVTTPQVTDQAAKEPVVLSLVKNDVPPLEKAAVGEDRPRVDAWLERRLRVFEHALTDLERRMNDGASHASRIMSHSEENANILVERIAFFERKQDEFQANVTQRLEETERRQRGLAAELRAGAGDTAGRLEKLEAWRRAQLARESVPDSSITTTAFTPVVPELTQTQSAEASPATAVSDEHQTEQDGYLDAARRAASAAEALSTMEESKPKDPPRRRSLGKRVPFSPRQNLTIGISILLCFVLGGYLAFRLGEAHGLNRAAFNPPRAIANVQHHVTKARNESHAALKPLDRLSSLANSGNARAELLVGLIYHHGEGTMKDAKRAAQWIGRAASRHEPLAEYWLGSLYEHGDGVAKNVSEALRWYAAAAAQGNRKAMHALGVAYASGIGAQKDLPEAAGWFERAAALGYVNSEFNLAVLCERGEGVPQSLREAYKWYALAAAQGDAESRLRADALKTQLSSEDLSGAEHAIEQFRPANLNREANVAPAMADLGGGAVLR